MRKPYRPVWWLILPICSTVVTGLRLAAMRGESGRLERTRATASSPTVPPGAPTIAFVQPPGSRRHLSPQPAWGQRVGAGMLLVLGFSLILAGLWLLGRPVPISFSPL